MGGKGCKPNSVFPAFTGERIIYLSGRYPKPVSLARNMERAAPGFPIWPCTRWGFPCLRDCSWSGGLLPHLFTLTSDRCSHQLRRFEFLWHFPSGRLAASPPACIPGLRPGLRGIAPCGVRTFLPRRLSVKPGAILRPSLTRGQPSPVTHPMASSARR
jgi:hypothetical protein